MTNDEANGAHGCSRKDATNPEEKASFQGRIELAELENDATIRNCRRSKGWLLAFLPCLFVLAHCGSATRDYASSRATGGSAGGASTAGSGASAGASRGLQAGASGAAGPSPGTGGSASETGNSSPGTGGSLPGTGGSLPGTGGSTIAAGGSASGAGGFSPGAAGTGPTCSGQAHNCLGSCVSNSSVDHCGGSCDPCQVPSGATATCDGNQCGFSCGGMKKCGSKCVPSDGCCNDNEIECPPQNGMARQCDTSSNTCKVSGCASGFKPCGSSCIENKACCSSSDCGGSCQTCSGPGGSCVAVKNMDDTDSCPGTCDGSGACRSKRGQACTTVSGGCIGGSPCSPDGYCCDTACTGQCMACDLNNKQGTCTPVPSGAPHGDRAKCTSDGSSCGGSCKGKSDGTCDYPTTSCSAAKCTATNMSVAESTCQAGKCPTVMPVKCEKSLICSGTKCKTSCDADGDCVSGFICAPDRTCRVKPLSNYHSECTAVGNARQGGCVAAVRRYCVQKGGPSGGITQETNSTTVAFGVGCFASGSSEHDVQVTEFTKLVAGCSNADLAQTPPCILAAHKWCKNNKNVELGFVQEVNKATPDKPLFTVACSPGAASTLSLASLASYVGGNCADVQASISQSCVSAAHRYCEKDKGKKGGMIQDVTDTSKILITCFDFVSYGDVPLL